MPPVNKRKKHARNFYRKADGSFYKLKINKNIQSRPPSTEQERTLPSRFNQELNYFLLVKVGKGEAWIDYRELTWEPTKNLRWKLKIDFELETIDFVWLYQRRRGANEQSYPRAVALVSLTNVLLAL
ncbi:LOW QUALITY PROTEIN: hypothetical protein PHMEG_0006159 [Phytophthora megakarya]|uniref:Chromo domain-containing protein n=1 Tax=Phytophthora megakarya TaxID=4795 RepID=A0A225WRA1_9STRA|nr:LOW QUALITY PROTEIN: hypothetical protein PHMEG_0006159 [Phytophthora megakarya]